MANFEQLAAAAARVLARQQAIRLAKDELARQGVPLHSVAMRDLQIRADELLAAHPHLIDEAAQRVAAHPEWLPKRRGAICLSIRKHQIGCCNR